ncbi:hypothetical protein D6777_03580 [Candidatus Woesearchaeota archaeon]|nr:MAG: hypothetical protein D6777_03580 [Candidatus Woesearchaeota archaeon]
MNNGTRWGLIGILTTICYFLISQAVLILINSSQLVKVLIFAMGILFALLLLYSGIMAFKNSARIFGFVNIVLGLLFFLLIISVFIKTLTLEISKIQFLF